nr:hypothetical protein [Clostridia bacterium]
MDFTTCLLEQMKRHPAMQPRDVLKLCYQAARGAEHLLADTARARAWFDQEYAATPADGVLPLFEPISGHVARVNIAAWKAANLPADWLFRMFVHTAGVPMGGAELLNQYIDEAAAVVSAMPGWADELAAWRESGMPAVHHSEAYRAAEKPAYRIVNRLFACILPLLQRLNAQQDVRVIALDGRAASGKTTKAALLGAVLEAPVIHMDDFFLPPALRTPERLSQPGGNVDYERFAAEVLPGLTSGEDFSYRIFDCGRMDFDGVREVPAAPIRIVEGSYAHHPALADYADLRVFSTVETDEQMARILLRNGERMAEIFRTRWIPMEEKYFAAFDVRGRAHLCL